jgi:hypothetical protein
MAVTEVIVGNTIPTENHLISSKDLFGLNPKQLDIKNMGKRMGPLPFWSPANAPERKKERGPRCDGGGGSSEERESRQVASPCVSMAAVAICLLS